MNKTKYKLNEVKLDVSQQGKNKSYEIDAFREKSYQKHSKSQELSCQNQFSQTDSQRTDISKKTLNSHAHDVIENVHDDQLFVKSSKKNMFEIPNISLNHRNENQELLVETQNNIKSSDITLDSDSTLMSCEIQIALNSTETVSFAQSETRLN